MKNLCISSLFLVLLATVANFAAPRELVIVNGLGETLDVVELSKTARSRCSLMNWSSIRMILWSTEIPELPSTREVTIFTSKIFVTARRSGTCFLGSGRNPYNGAFFNSDTFFVTNLVSSTVTKIKVSDRRVVSEFPVSNSIDSDSPQGILIRNRRAYICLSSFNDLFEYDAGKLEVRDCNNDTLIARVTVGVNPQVARIRI